MLIERAPSTAVVSRMLWEALYQLRNDRNYNDKISKPQMVTFVAVRFSWRWLTVQLSQ